MNWKCKLALFVFSSFYGATAANAAFVFYGRVDNAFSRLERSTDGSDAFSLISKSGINTHFDFAWHFNRTFETALLLDYTQHSYEGPTTRTLNEEDVAPFSAGLALRLNSQYVSLFLNALHSQWVLIKDISATSHELEIYSTPLVQTGFSLQGKAHAYEMFVDLYLFGPLSPEDYENQAVQMNYGLGAQGRVEFGRGSTRWGFHLRIDLSEIDNGDKLYTSSTAYGGLFLRILGR